MSARWHERSCDRCLELEEILEAQDEHVNLLERQLDSLTTQLAACHLELMRRRTYPNAEL